VNKFHHTSPGRAGRSGSSLSFSLPLFFLVALWASAPQALSQQQPPAKTMQLGSLEFTGLQRITKEQAISASGLQVGQQFDVAMLDAAAQKLVNSGLFTTISYRMRGSVERAVVTFEVEEPKGRGLPVVFDNFVWFNEGEIIDAVRKELPTFDGTALESSTVLCSSCSWSERFKARLNTRRQRTSRAEMRSTSLASRGLT
jgi:hypothetical protein